MAEQFVQHINLSSSTPVANPAAAASFFRSMEDQQIVLQIGQLSSSTPPPPPPSHDDQTKSASDHGTLNLKDLVALVMLACFLVCFLSSFTDSLQNGKDSKVYYGIATCNGLHIFNHEDPEIEKKALGDKLKDMKIIKVDYLHAFLSVFVFLIFACSSLEVQTCYFPAEIRDQMEYSMVIYLALVVGLLSSFLFACFPTNRRGIG
ncbi:hypothetical protein ACLB2K_064564 [Fragaria x ananassa]